MFFTVNGGGAWTKLKGGSPTIAFRDLVIQTRENDLVGATFGRSFYILDDYSPLRAVNSHPVCKDFAPYVLKSENRGRSWRSIAGNLPDRHVLWRIVQDHEQPGLLFLGSESFDHRRLRKRCNRVEHRHRVQVPR